MRLPRNVYRPLVGSPKETLQDLFVRFGTALSPQLYQAETAPTRPFPPHRKLRPAVIQQSITRHHQAQLGGVFVLALLSFLESGVSGVLSNPACPASGPTSLRPSSL